MKRGFSILMATVMSAALIMVALGTATVTATIDKEGCTPGYWKQPHHSDSWGPTGYEPDDKFNDTFDVAFFGPDTTLIQVLWLQGEKTGINKLGAHAVAFLLNVNHPDVNAYHFEQWLLDKIKDVATGNKKAVTGLKSHLDTDNNQGCPLN